MKVHDMTTNTVIAERVQWAKNFVTRFKGLMFKEHLDIGEGILLHPCNSIHMFFMKISLDILFLDDNMMVLKQINGIKPGQISPVVKNGKYVLELGDGSLAQYGNLEGHQLSIMDSSAAEK